MIEKTIEGEGYTHAKVGEWIAQIVKVATDRLADLKTGHKFIGQIFFFPSLNQKAQFTG